MIEKIIKQVNSEYKTKKELKDDIEALELLRDIDKKRIKELKKEAIKKDKKIDELEKELEENEIVEEVVESLENKLDKLIIDNHSLRKELTEVKENNQAKDYEINNLRRELELEQYERGRVSDELVRTEKKLNRERNKNSKLNIELLQVKNINKELINKVNISAIARHQLKELCKYTENDNKEPDKVKRPGVLVHKQVSGVKVYELANLM
ncbi:MAG: hypothetical protein MJH09_10800 [Cetobacterium sp.]|nr:hypothetical protein [Cetobacterium sp.]